jgi:hypothetical protein
MVYDIVLKNGQEVVAYTSNGIDSVLEMMFRHGIFIIKENSFPEKVTYILPDQVSHFRFPKDGIGVAKPV